MEAAIRFSQNSLPGDDKQYFLKIDVANRLLQLYNLQHYGKNNLKYELVSASKKLSPFRAFDWHPTEPSLVAVGLTGGEACLVDLKYPEHKPLSFTARSPRSCNAIALNVSDWIAVGLEKARTDHGLYIWDINRQTTQSSSKALKNSSTSLHKIASGEHVASLRFFQDNPQLLAAAVQGYIRLYDLREGNSSPVLQISTKCVHNIAIDTQDENYFASCLPSNSPTVAVWDRRMVSRTEAAYFGFANTVGQSDQQPEVSAELTGIADPDSHIFGLRFSKTHRGRLGVLSSTGRLRVINFLKSSHSHDQKLGQEHKPLQWNKQEPRAIYVDNIQVVTESIVDSSEASDDQRLLSFDFTTARSRRDQPTVITLNRGGQINVRAATRFQGRSSMALAVMLNDRLSVELQNPVDSSSAAITSVKDTNQSTLANPLLLARERCLNGYLLDSAANQLVAKHDTKLVAFWSWLEHSKTISANAMMVEGDLDLSYLGISDVWMEEVDIQTRTVRNAFRIEHPRIATTITDATNRLNLVRGRGCSTDFPRHRCLSLHILGLPWLKSDIQEECDKLLSEGELTKAAAVALFAGEAKMAQKALRSPGSGKSHKMLAMALMSSRNRYRKPRRSSHDSSRSNSDETESDDSQDEEWRDIISAVAEDLTDSYAKSILAFVKTKSWQDVVSQAQLPLRYRVLVALRHCDDDTLTMLLQRMKDEAISSGDLEGILLTGLGSTDSIELLTQYNKITNDLQTTTLAMSFDAVCDRFLPSESSYIRTIHCFREVYKSQLMSLGLKFDKARFNVALSRAVREKKLTYQPRKKEQIRLVCSHCNQSMAQFGHDQDAEENENATTETKKHPLGPAKAAVAGTVCPKCGRHLPRCGVCDMWLGTPDETFSKWYKHPVSSSHRNSNHADLSGSMVGSTVTAIGPGSGTPKVPIPGVQGGVRGEAISKRLTSADLMSTAVEIVDEEVTRQQEEKRWYEVMHKLMVFCTRCTHGFHAEHAKMWFEGSGGTGGHNFCPVPQCGCVCNAQ